MVTIEEIIAWMLIVVRALGLMLMIPAFYHRSFPVVARIALAAMLALLALPGLPETTQWPDSLVGLVMLGGRELAIGLGMGLSVRLLFIILEFASHLLTFEMGLRPGPIFDPMGRSAGNPMGALFYYGGVVLLFSGTQYAILHAFVRSLHLLPLGPAVFAGETVGTMIAITSRIFGIGLLMAAPVMAVNFVINLLFALLGRVVPRMNVFILSLAVRILAGLTVLFFSMSLIVHYILAYLQDVPEWMLRFLLFRSL